VLNGLLVDWLKAPSLIVTIGTQYLYRGILLTFVGTVFFMNVPHAMDQFGKLALARHDTASGLHAVLPATVLVLVLASALTWWLLNKTLMGRAVYAVGGSLAIAERLGYKLRSVHLFVFGYAGFLSGLAGIVHVSSTRLANPFDLVGSELDVIAAVVLGGARITGGHGSVVGTLLGVLLVTLINNVLILAGVAQYLAESHHRRLHRAGGCGVRAAAESKFPVKDTHQFSRPSFLKIFSNHCIQIGSSRVVPHVSPVVAHAATGCTRQPSISRN
jgi:simple sugar transport system permease protein